MAQGLQREIIPAPQTFPVVETDEGPMTYAFGHLWPVQNDISLHLNAARVGLTKAQGGLGRTRHRLEARLLIWPHSARTLHEWTVTRYKELSSEYKIITMASGSGTAKSTDTAWFALQWWWENPEERTVLICSTTLSMLRKRIWAEVSSAFYKAHGGMPGIVRTNPYPQILYSRQDERHGIHGIALKQGDTERTLADLIGIHPEEGLLVIVDEATDAPDVQDAITNWESGGVDFKLVMLGNSKSKFDPHGRCSEPVKGWNSVHPDIDEKWETKMGGVCLFFDCYKSPGIHSPDRANLHFLMSDEDIKAKEKRLGKNSPKFWRFVRGFWPPEDITKTVCTLTMIEKYRMKERIEWSGDWIIKIAYLDPAFTSEGDECILSFADWGMGRNGKMMIDFGGDDYVITLELDANSKEPITYQVIRKARHECEVRGVHPEHFGLDTWGFGQGAGDICEREWSPDIHRVIGIGSPTDRFIDSVQAETAKDAYDRITTEMWFAMKDFGEAGQIGGLDDISVEELCSREWMWKGRKMSLEGKKDYKKRMGREDSPTGSPDRSDSRVGLLEVARRNGFMISDREEDTAQDYEEWAEKYEEMLGLNEPEEWEKEDKWGNVNPILASSGFGDPD